MWSIGHIYAVSYAFKIYLFCQYITDNYYIYLVLIRYCARFFFSYKIRIFYFKATEAFCYSLKSYNMS